MKTGMGGDKVGVAEMGVAEMGAEGNLFEGSCWGCEEAVGASFVFGAC